MSQTIDGSPWGDHGDHLFAGTATRHGAVAEGPFLLPQPAGTQYAVASETTLRTGLMEEPPPQFAEYESPVGPESLCGEEYEEHDVATPGSAVVELDPYMAIRPALSPAHAHLTAEEVAVRFGRMPAVIALHQALASAVPQQAVLAVLLGRAGRRSLPLNGTDLPIGTFMRQLSRLFREAAEYHETQLGPEAGAAPLEGEIPMSRTAIKKAEAFPGAFADPLDDGSTAKSQKLKNALAAARAVAGTPDALKTLPIVIVSLDPAGPPYPHADTKATEVDFSASLLKMAALYSAFQLRVTANAVAGAMQNVPAAKVFEELSAALDPTIDAAVPLITREKAVTAAMRVPRYQDIFDATPVAGDGLMLSFKPFFENALSDMIVLGDDNATAFIIHALGYSYINGVLQSAGFFRNAKTQSGIWLAGDYLLTEVDPRTKKHTGFGRFKGKIMPQWPYVRIDSVNDQKVAQATTCLDMAKLFVLLHDKKLVTDPAGNQEMLDLLAGAVAHNQFWLTHKPPHWTANDFIAGLSYTNTHSKIGVEKLKTNKPVWSEGTILNHATSGRDFVVVWQDLRDGNLVTELSEIVDRTIISFLTP